MLTYFHSFFLANFECSKRCNKGNVVDTKKRTINGNIEKAVKIGPKATTRNDTYIIHACEYVCYLAQTSSKSISRSLEVDV